jgi:hypothetical protein
MSVTRVVSVYVITELCGLIDPLVNPACGLKRKVAVPLRCTYEALSIGLVEVLLRAQLDGHRSITNIQTMTKPIRIQRGRFGRAPALALAPARRSIYQV